MAVNDPQATDAALKQLQAQMELVLRDVHAWTTWEYWLALAVGIAGTFLAWLAYQEAQEAKKAAREAGRSVKIQTITIELTEIAQKLDKLEPQLNFNEARDLLTEISRRLRRLISPFQDDTELGSTIKLLREALDAAKIALNTVRPIDPGKEQAPQAVYYAIQGDFATINSIVADLLGLFEKKSINFGADNAGGN
jgi:hypothetical protein